MDPKVAVELADAPPEGEQPHAYEDDGSGKCKVCGQSADAPVHTSAPANMTLGSGFEALLFTEGELSRDGRMIASGASFWGDLPLTLMGMIEDTGLGGHSGSQVTGQIQNLTRSGNDIQATGQFDSSEFAMNIERLVRDGTMSGISVDLAPVEWRIEAVPLPEEESDGLVLVADSTKKADAPADAPDRETVAEEKMDDMVFVVTKGEVMGATICPMPAFANAAIHLTADGQPERITLYGSIKMLDAPEKPVEGDLEVMLQSPEGAVSIGFAPASTDPQVIRELMTEADELLAEVDVPVDFMEGGGFLLNLPVAKLQHQLSDAVEGFRENHIFTVMSNDEKPLGESPLVFKSVRFGEYEFSLGTNSLTASAAGLVPEAPPKAWFDNPNLSEATALSVDENGRVSGHAATWNVCHVGHSNTCIMAPRSKKDYAYFMLGEVETEEGERVAVGQITLDTGHAPDSFSRTKTRRHYDDTGTAVADVVVGEDEHGIWMAGALRADATAGHVRKLRGAKVSGDWREVNGNLELVALLAVNVPGFPVPRARAQIQRTKSGDVRGLALVAAGIVGEDTGAPLSPTGVGGRGKPVGIPEAVSLRLLEKRLTASGEDGFMATLLELVV